MHNYDFPLSIIKKKYYLQAMNKIGKKSALEQLGRICSKFK